MKIQMMKILKYAKKQLRNYIIVFGLVELKAKIIKIIMILKIKN